MKVRLLNVQLSELFRRALLPDWIRATVESCSNDETAVVGRVADQIDDGLVRAERPATPIHREESVLDLIPFARPWREVADVNGQIERVC